MLVASALLALLVSSAFAVLLVAVHNESDAAELARHSQAVLAAANQLERLVVDMESGERGYLLTGEQRFLAPWEDARVDFPNAARQLTELVPLSNPQHQSAVRLQEMGESYIRDYSVPLIAAARRGDPAARSTASIEEGKSRVDAIRAEFEALDAAERNLADTRDHEAQVAANRATLAAALGIAGSVVLIVIFTVYLARAIVVPVRRASAMAGHLAGGDLDARLPETGIGEIGLLERSFNTMGRSLHSNQDELARLAGEQAALRRVATFVARGVAPSEVFAVVVEEIGQLLGADGTRMLRYEPDNSVTVVAVWGVTADKVPVGTRTPLTGVNVASEVLRTGAPCRMDSMAEATGPLPESMAAAGVRSTVGAPIVVEGRIWGVMTALGVGDRPLAADAEARFVDFTDLVATAISNTEARTQLTASRARAVDATDRTRRAIERDLHDGTQQRLVSLSLDLRTIEAQMGDDLPGLRSEVSDVADGLGDALEELRELARGIHPAILTAGGLAPALRALARRSPMPVQLDIRNDSRLPQRVEVAAYYVVAEALTNATKHAQATLVSVSVSRTNGRLRLVVSDDGVGGADPAHGTGLIGLVDRVAALEGTISVDSPAGRGTTLRVELPVELSSDGSAGDVPAADLPAQEG